MAHTSVSGEFKYLTKTSAVSLCSLPLKWTGSLSLQIFWDLPHTCSRPRPSKILDPPVQKVSSPRFYVLGSFSANLSRVDIADSSPQFLFLAASKIAQGHSGCFPLVFAISKEWRRKAHSCFLKDCIVSSWLFLSLSVQNPFSTSLMFWNLALKSLDIWISDSAARNMFGSGSLKEELREIMSASALSNCLKVMNTPPKLFLFSVPTQTAEEEMHGLRSFWPESIDIWLSISCRNLVSWQSQN